MALERSSMSTRNRLALSALTVLIVGSPLLFGGAFAWCAVLIAWASLVTFAAATLASDRTRLVDGVFGVMMCAWLWTCLQIVPLPSGWAHALGLPSADNIALLPAAVAAHIPFTVSIDPGATQAQVLVGISLLCAFASGRLIGRPRLIARAVSLSAVVVGLCGLGHWALGLDRVFGLYEPRFTTPRLLSSLMSNNHMGGFLAMGALVSTGLALDRRERHLKGVFIAAASLCALLVPVTLSRGAIGALLFGASLLFFVLRRGESPMRLRSWAPLLTAGVALGVSVFVALGPLLRRFETEDFNKLETAGRALGLLQGSTWWLGVGRGAFSAAFVAKEGTSVRVTHPENLVVQWITEWGVPVGTTLLLVVSIALVRRMRESQTPAELGIAVAIAAVALQNMVDFSLEMTGIVVVVAAMFGATLKAKDVATGPASTRWWKVGMLLVFLGALSGLSRSVVHNEVQPLVDRLRALMATEDDTAFEATLERALVLHPAEPSFALLAGAYAVQRERPDAPRWLSTAMLQAPGWASPHAVASQWLLRQGRLDQALLEIREAERRQPGSAREVLCEVLRERGTLALLERAAPPDAGAGHYERVVGCPRIDDALVRAIDARILELDPDSPSALVRHARRLRASQEPTAAVALLTDAVDAHPLNAHVWNSLASALLETGRPDEALSALKKAEAHGVSQALLLESRARIEATLKDTTAMRATLMRMRGLSRGDAQLMADARFLEATLEADLGNIDRALRAFEASDQARPNAAALRQAAALALKTNRLERAHQLYRELCRRDPNDGSCRKLRR